MSDITRATFVDVDPSTGHPTPTTFSSMHSSLMRWYPVGETVPANIRDLLLTAVDYFALSYEQANGGRGQLYERLTNDAFLKAVLALELALRDRLGRGRRVKLETLIADAVTTGLLAGTPELTAIWTLLRDNRNALAHGREDQSSFGPMTSSWSSTDRPAGSGASVGDIPPPPSGRRRRTGRPRR